jgi:putative ABC transport system permease protein
MKKNQWLWNVVSVVALIVGLVLWIMLPWQGVLVVAVLPGALM